MEGVTKPGLEARGWGRGGGECCSVHGKHQLPPRRARASRGLHALAGVSSPLRFAYLTSPCSLSTKPV